MRSLPKDGGLIGSALRLEWLASQDSSKGGAVETGCSDVYDVIHSFIIYDYPHPLHPPPTAPHFDECPAQGENKPLGFLAALLLGSLLAVAPTRFACPRFT